jgi:hypothetical protein
MVPKQKLFKNIPLHAQGLNCKTCICELEYHVGEKGLLKSPKPSPQKKNHLAITNHLLKNVLMKSAFPYALSPCHKRAK